MKSNTVIWVSIDLDIFLSSVTVKRWIFFQFYTEYIQNRFILGSSKGVNLILLGLNEIKFNTLLCYLNLFYKNLM